MMKIWRTSFNIYLLSLAMAVLAGCAGGGAGKSTTKPGKKASTKEASTIRFHYVMNPDGTPRCQPISVYRASPMTFYVDSTPFLWEAYVTRASVTTNFGTYGLRLEFERQGAIALQTFTAHFKSRRIAIRSDFGESRWLAAPIVTEIITNGVYEFTPDASHDEMERIARGLNTLAAKSGTWLDKREKRQAEKEKAAAKKP